MKSGTRLPPDLGGSTSSMGGLPCHLVTTGVPAQASPPSSLGIRVRLLEGVERRGR